jgi:hypothetical protein
MSYAGLNSETFMQFAKFRTAMQRTAATKALYTANANSYPCPNAKEWILELVIQSPLILISKINLWSTRVKSIEQKSLKGK